MSIAFFRSGIIKSVLEFFSVRKTSRIVAISVALLKMRVVTTLAKTELRSLFSKCSNAYIFLARWKFVNIYPASWKCYSANTADYRSIQICSASKPWKPWSISSCATHNVTFPRIGPLVTYSFALKKKAIELCVISAEVRLLP